MIISMIVAHGNNREIGLDNKMPWHIKEDFKHFKKTTMGHHLIMGRKTYESIGKPLPGRTTIVLTRDENYKADGFLIASSLEKAITMAKSAGDDEVFIAGGANIYEQAISHSDKIYLSLVDYSGEADTFFPKIHESEWSLTRETPHEGFLLQVLLRKSNS